MNATRACTSGDCFALMPLPVLHTSGSSRTVDLSPGVLSTKTYLSTEAVRGNEGRKLRRKMRGDQVLSRR